MDGITPALITEVSSILLILQSYLPIRPIDVSSETGRATVGALFDAAFLVHHASDEEEIEGLAELALSVWKIVQGDSAEGSVLSEIVVEGLKAKVKDTTCRVS